MGSLQQNKLQIPVIDISAQNPNASTQLLDAAEKYGFIFIENNEIGIPPGDISRLFNLSHQFFALPIDVKEQVAISSNKAGKNHGWLSRGIEKLDPATQKRPDVKEALNIGEHINGELQQPLPQDLEAQLIIDFQNTCYDFCNKIFKQFARALDLDEDWFVARHDRSKGTSGTVLRLLYYPKTDDVERGVDIRAGAHSDFGSITLLFQQPGQPGLEIQTAEGEWAPVPVDPHAEANGVANGGGVSGRAGDDKRALPILINFGDLLEDWTGGLFKSTVHRVVFPQGEQQDRYSIAYFCQPLDDARLEPVPSKLVQDYAARTGKTSTRNGKVLTSKDHLMERLAATYTLKS